MMASQFIKWKYPYSILTSGSLGTMGVGLPYAVGCQIAYPNKLVIDIDGDGSFNHTLSELKSVKNRLGQQDNRTTLPVFSNTAYHTGQTG